MPEKLRTNAWFLAFLALLWLGATFAYFGNTGKHSDDYWTTFWAIDGAHLDWKHTPWNSWPYFWRPLHLIHIWFNNTVFWNHDWVPHLELAIVHGLVCLLLYRLLIRLNSARGPALCAALLFGTCPLLGEATNWSSASCNAIGAALMLWTLLLVHRLASREPIRPPHDPPPLGLLAAIMAVAFAAACFYEPAGAGLAIAPIIAWVAASGATRASRIHRTVWTAFAAGAPCILYAALLALTAPKGNRGASESFVHFADLPAVAAHLLHMARVLLWGYWGRDILLGSIQQGWGIALHRTTITAIVLGTLLAGAAALFSWARTRETNAPSDESRRGPGGILPLLGALLFLVSFLPFIASAAKGIELRSIYIPMLGIALLIAGAGNALRRASLRIDPPLRRRLTTATLAIVGLAAIAGQIGLIGFQSQFRANYRLDARIAQQLAQLAPRVEPQTVFLILQAEHRGAATSRGLYNTAVHTALEAPWSATTFFRRAMKRVDVHLIIAAYWDRAGVPIGDLTPAGLHRARSDGGYTLGWSVIVPLWIDPNANVHIVDTLTIQPRDGEPFDVSPARARRLAGPSGEWLAKPDSGRFQLIDLGHDSSRVVHETVTSPPDDQTPPAKGPIVPGG